MTRKQRFKTISRRRILQTTGAFTVGGLSALAGCSGGGSTSGNDESGSTSGNDESGSTSGNGSGARGQNILIAPSTGPTTLDPQNHRETTTETYLIHFYNGLVTRNQKMEIIPDVATEWSNPDKTTWEFSLREGVKFTNGEEFTAETVKYNLERVSGNLNDRTLPIQDLYTTIKDIEVVNKHTARVNLNTPDALFLENQAELLYVPKKYTEENGFKSLNDDPVGTGPYTLESWKRDQKMVMTDRDDYFRGAAPVSTIEWQPMPEASSRLTALTSDDIDLIRSLSPQAEKRVSSSLGSTVKKVRSARSAALWLNMEQEVYGRDDPVFYDNPELRKAVNYAIDTNGIIEGILGGNGARTHGWAPSKEYVGYNPNIEPYPYDPDKARSLRKKGGYEDGELSLTLLVPRERYYKGVASSEAIATMLGEIGIDVELNAIEFGQFSTQTQEQKIPGLMFAAWGNPKFNALDAYLPLVSLEGLFSLLPNSDQQQWVKTVAQKIKTAQRTVNRDKLDKILQECEQILHDNAAFSFLFQYRDVYGANSKLNWKPRPDEVMYMYNASWK